MIHLNIKRRLFISNILALVVPILLSFVMFVGMMFVVMEVTKTHDEKLFDGDGQPFYDSIKKIDQIISNLPKTIEVEQIKAVVDEFNRKHSVLKVSLSIYEGKKLLYPSSSYLDSSIMNIALAQNNNHTFSMDNIAIYRANVGKYTILLTDTNFNNHDNENYKDYRNRIINEGIIMFLFIIVIILLTNRFLTKFVFKRIITPIETLVYGVHQIRDGNLDYNIEYTENDEFAGVCSDFNEMAQRLSDSVKARQKDESNRKELIAGISHDLRTPLTSIKAYVEGLEMGVASTPETQKHYLDTIKSKSNDLEHIVNQLFLFSKLDIGEFPFYLEKVDIGKYLSEMVSNLSYEYKNKGLNIMLTENVESICVNVDKVQLRNALINILENSVKYKEKSEGEMKISCTKENDYIKIRLEDNGPGVSSDAIEKLFDIFYRGDSSRSNPSKGSGLGLSITTKILERLSGSILAENVTDGGLAIIMKLPINKNVGGNRDGQSFNN
ncbi:sensor histidine kinase [Clostridium zeae]|nr:HAMP domain-containing sensor histidine kinase [Clostridium zeae]